VATNLLEAGSRHAALAVGLPGPRSMWVFMSMWKVPYGLMCAQTSAVSAFLSRVFSRLAQAGFGKDLLDDERVDEDERGLEEMHPEHRDLLVFAVGAGELGVLAVEDELHAAVPMLNHLDSTGDVLPAGQPETYQVQVTNTSSAPAAYFVDPRLSTSATLNLAALTSPSITLPLQRTSVPPAYLVPTHTTAIYPAAQTSGATPIEFDAQAPAGDPDIGSTVGSSVTGSLLANPVAPGAWTVAPDVIGPFGATGVSEQATTAMSAIANAFDPSVSSSTGDLWQASVNPSALTGLSPVVIGPGRTGTITVTITPTGPAGSHASGTLYLDVEDLFLLQVYPEPNGSEAAAIPYSYTLG
jgi:hypothetical protein